ncbi:putative leader peptide [Streptomyces hokutonensis]|uniref:Leader peptide n=1 Tax=Streptomyces hokutonensis TaxID=1306990 RepID=A0ABW6MFK8_9ACTN
MALRTRDPVAGVPDMEDGVLNSYDPSASCHDAVVFSRLSRRRHIDLQRFTSCLCHS